MSTAENLKFAALLLPFTAMGGVVGAIFGMAVPWGVLAEAHGFDAMQSQADVGTNVFWSTIAGIGGGAYFAHNASRDS